LEIPHPSTCAIYRVPSRSVRTDLPRSLNLCSSNRLYHIKTLTVGEQPLAGWADYRGR